MSYTPYRRGMWQPIKREEAAAPRSAPPSTEQEKIAWGLAWIRRNYMSHRTEGRP